MCCWCGGFWSVNLLPPLKSYCVSVHIYMYFPRLVYDPMRAPTEQRSAVKFLLVSAEYEQHMWLSNQRHVFFHSNAYRIIGSNTHVAPDVRHMKSHRSSVNWKRIEKRVTTTFRATTRLPGNAAWQIEATGRIFRNVICQIHPSCKTQTLSYLCTQEIQESKLSSIQNVYWYNQIVVSAKPRN